MKPRRHGEHGEEQRHSFSLRVLRASVVNMSREHRPRAAGPRARRRWFDFPYPRTRFGKKEICNESHEASSTGSLVSRRGGTACGHARVCGPPKNQSERYSAAQAAGHE